MWWDALLYSALPLSSARNLLRQDQRLGETPEYTVETTLSSACYSGGHGRFTGTAARYILDQQPRLAAIQQRYRYR